MNWIFFSPLNVNIGEAFTKKGKYEWGINEIYFTPYEDGEKEKIFISPSDGVVQMYQDQMKDFCKFISSGNSRNASFKDGMNVLKIIEKVENR